MMRHRKEVAIGTHFESFSGSLKPQIVEILHENPRSPVTYVVRYWVYGHSKTLRVILYVQGTVIMIHYMRKSW